MRAISIFGISSVILSCLSFSGPSAFASDDLARNFTHFMNASQQVVSQVTTGNQFATNCAAMTTGAYVGRMNSQTQMVIAQRTALQRGVGILVRHLENCTKGQPIPDPLIRGAKDSLKEGGKSLARVYEEARSTVTAQRQTIMGYITCESQPTQTARAQALFGATITGLDRMAQLAKRMEEQVNSLERARYCPD